MEGTVKRFDNAKGYGFIGADGQEKDVFVHHTAIKMDGYRKLSPGQRVRFDVEPGTKGPQATNVEVIG